MPVTARPATLGTLKKAIASGDVRRRSVKDEVRDNLILKLRAGDRLFPGVVGYDDTVIPQLVNAILAKHHFILLGLRGQAKTRLIRALVDLLDDAIPVVPGSEVHDDPLAPISAHGKALVATEGDDLPIEWRGRDARYVEKLATPDVTIADLIGDIDPIKAASSGLQLGSELAMHFGLLPRANRGLFAINELPDLASKVQVGLFNILQEGDVQIKGFPVRLPLDVMIVFTANPEDYTARGKIITPLKDRIGAEIRTHYLHSRADAMAVTEQEAWVERGLRLALPTYVREVVEEVAFQARQDRRIDRRSGVSQRLPISVLETVVSNAERRALIADEGLVAPRVTDVYAALPSINGGTVLLGDGLPATSLVVEASKVPGLIDLAARAGLPAGAPAPLVAAAVDFVLEGLHAQKRIGRTEAGGYVGTEPVRRPVTQTMRQAPAISLDEDDAEPGKGKKKKYYN